MVYLSLLKSFCLCRKPGKALCLPLLSQYRVIVVICGLKLNKEALLKQPHWCKVCGGGEKAVELS